MMFPKNKRTRLSLKKLRELMVEVYERDNGRCAICGCNVPYGAESHHVMHGSKKTDTIDNLITLCYDCHQEVHFGKNCTEVDRECKKYLYDMYGGVAGETDIEKLGIEEQPAANPS